MRGLLAAIRREDEDERARRDRRRENVEGGPKRGRAAERGERDAKRVMRRGRW